MSNKDQNQKGFTLVETLVAIAIFASSITGLMSITARGINDNVFVKNKLTASYLSQEGVELVRNIRDTSAINGEEWSQFLNTIADCYSQNGSNVCQIDGTQQVLTPTPCPQGVCDVMRRDDANGEYDYDILNDESPFTRYIEIQSVGSLGSDEIYIRSIVEWQRGSNTHSVIYTYNLFSWAN